MERTKRVLALGTVFVLVVGLGSPAHGQSRQDMIEHFFGASNINAVAGNGGLSIGISPLGDLAVLTWPSPSYTDQVLHVGSNALDVREQRNMMGHGSMGSFLGLHVETADGSEVTWLRDVEWEIVQGYGDPEAAVVETRFTHVELGLTVVVSDFVLPDSDVWVRHVTVTRDSTSPVQAATAIWYSNFAPTLSRVPQLPLADWAFDAYNDFAALYDTDSDAVLHFRPASDADITEMGNLLNPRDIDYGAVGEALAATGFDAADARALVDSLDTHYGAGVYLALGAAQTLAGYQIGFDETPVCDVVDTMVDNVLSLPNIFPDVTLPLDPSLLEVIRCEEAVHDIIAANGWVVTAQDAFLDAALDIAGYPELVEQHNRFYLQTIRTEDADAELFINDDPPPDPSDPSRKVFPAWSWEMNYYADGMVGGNIRFEIDNTGLAVWSLVAHAGYIDDEADRLAYLNEIWPVVQSASNLLVRWKDLETGLHAPAHEDDNYAYTQTLHGAVAVYAGLANAARAARTLGLDDDAERYENRAWELKQAVLTHLYNEDTGLFMEGLDDRTNPGNLPGGSSSWLVWPARMLPFGDDRVQRQLRANLDYAGESLDPDGGGGAYVTKILIAAALAADDPASRADVEAALQAMVRLVATPDTAILGETFVPVDSDGDGTPDRFSTRVSNPHLWAAILVYLTAMALYHPEQFDWHLDVLVDLHEPTTDSGCGCRPTTTDHSGALLLIPLWLAWLRRRRHHPALHRPRLPPQGGQRPPPRRS
jgi:MYXO-CTERM domain-containing protein